MIFRADQLARAWLSVALASGTDDERAALHRTIAIESYSTGVRLVATDSYVLLHAFVPTVEHDLDDEPAFDEAPYSVAVAMDPHKRGAGILSYALKLQRAREKDQLDLDPIEVKLDLGVVIEEEEGTGGFAGMEPRWAVLEMPDVERVKLQLFEGLYPDWRVLFAGFKARQADLVALNPEIVGRLASISKWHGLARLGFVFGGPEKAIKIIGVDTEPAIGGIVMPMRWDLERNAPREDTPKADKGEEG